MDELGADLTTLLGTLRILEPELWRSSERRFILPQKLEDLEKPEYLKEIKEKIQRLKRLKDMLDCGSITNAEYISLKDNLILENAMSICDHDEIKMAESFGVPSNSWHNEGNENLNEVDKHEGWCD